jgi:alkylation response protein AidB-like acyl-CoA dehydrogenase
MNSTEPQNPEGVSDSERDLLRQSVRDLLASIWPADKAVENCADAQAVAKLWQAMARQGLASLGCASAGVGLRETLVVFEELGRASCPAPLLGAVAANLALATQTSNAARADEPGSGRVSGARTIESPRWALASLASAARALLEDLHQGNASIALALGTFDGDPAAGGVTVHGDALQGKLSFVEGAQAVTHLLICTEMPAGVAVVAADARGLTMRAMPGLAVPPFCEITLDDVPALRLDLAPEALAEIAAVARLACAGQALGAAQRAFDLAVEHAKVRKQFGQLIGQFQAVQHKLANCLISLDGARLALEAAAAERDAGNSQWCVFAAAAVAFASPALRTVSIETHRALGAIGYAEEHEAPRHFRRVHADLARFGGMARARAELADVLLGPVQ